MKKTVSKIRRVISIIILTSLIALIILGFGYVFFSQNYDKTFEYPRMCTLHAQTGLIINLTDADGNSIKGAKIVADQKNELFYEGDKGAYSGLVEGKGKYTFTINKEGFKTYTGKVNLKHDGCHVITQTKNITLIKK